MKKTYEAVPVNSRGHERESLVNKQAGATATVLRGDYTNYRRFCQFRLNRHGVPWQVYNVYAIIDGKRILVAPNAQARGEV